MAMSGRTRFKIIGPIAVVGGIILIVVGVQKSSVSAKVASEGVVTKGRIVSHRTINGRRGSKTYKLSADYQAGDSGPGISKEFTVPTQLYERLADGDEVEIRYLPSDPSSAELVGAEVGAAEQIGPGAAIALFGLVSSFFAYRKTGPSA